MNISGTRWEPISGSVRIFNDCLPGVSSSTIGLKNRDNRFPLAVQNEGTPAAPIANICRNYLEPDLQSDQPHDLLKKARITCLNKLVRNICAFCIVNYPALLYLLP